MKDGGRRINSVPGLLFPLTVSLSFSCFSPCSAAYLWHILLSPGAPGAAAWQQSAEALQSVFNESINFFYVNVGLNVVGLSPLPAVASHPVSEVSCPCSLLLGPVARICRPSGVAPTFARRSTCCHLTCCCDPEVWASLLHCKLHVRAATSQQPPDGTYLRAAVVLPQAVFNFVNAWSLMLGPLIFADRKAANVPKKLLLWIGTMVCSLTHRCSVAQAEPCLCMSILQLLECVKPTACEGVPTWRGFLHRALVEQLRLYILCAVPDQHLVHRLHGAARNESSSARRGRARGSVPAAGAGAGRGLDCGSRRRRVHWLGAAGAAGIWRHRRTAVLRILQPRWRQVRLKIRSFDGSVLDPHMPAEATAWLEACLLEYSPAGMRKHQVFSLVCPPAGSSTHLWSMRHCILCGRCGQPQNPLLRSRQCAVDAATSDCSAAHAQGKLDNEI